MNYTGSAQLLRALQASALDQGRDSKDYCLLNAWSCSLVWRHKCFEGSNVYWTVHHCNS